MIKKLILLGLLCLAFRQMHAQAPEFFDFQCITRNNEGKPLAETDIAIRFSIVDQSPGGPVLYSEQHKTRTNAYGLVMLQVGAGEIESGDFQDINWGVGAKYLSVEMDRLLDGSFVELGVSQLVSVPYALYAKEAGNVNTGDTSAVNELQLLSFSGNQLSISQGNSVLLPDSVNDADHDPGNELQMLQIAADTLWITQGNYVVLPDSVNDADHDPGNELQMLQIVADTLWLTQGNYVVLPDSVNDADHDPVNELQMLGISYDTISLTNGNYVVLPDSLHEMVITQLLCSQVTTDSLLYQYIAGQLIQSIYAQIDSLVSLYASSTVFQCDTLLIGGQSISEVIRDVADTTSWVLDGNSGTDPVVHKLGTTDNAGLSIATNDTTRVFVTADGQTGFGNSAPVARVEVGGALALNCFEIPVVTGTNNLVIGNRSFVVMVAGPVTKKYLGLSDGLVNGQLLYLNFNALPTDEIEFTDLHNLTLKGAVKLLAGQTVHFIWYNGFWIEL